MRKYYILFLILFSVFGCTPESPKDNYQDPVEKVLNEQINYTIFSENGFSVSHPDWERIDQDNELTVSKGYCTVAVNSETIPAKQWYDMFEQSIASQDGEILSSDQNNFQVIYSFDFQKHTLISEIRLYECNDRSIAVTLSCIEEVTELMTNISSHIYPSADCKVKETVYNNFQDADYSIKYPDWEGSLEKEEQRVLGVTKGVCSVVVDKHNALPKDIINWLNNAIDNQNIIDSSEQNDEYDIVYQLQYENSTITATTKVFYCNYQSYLTQVLCMDAHITDDDVIIRDTILDSARCAKEYEIPTPMKIEEEKEIVIEKEPEVIEKIEDEIVKTDAGEEFGIDEEMVVYFINSNEFFTKIMKDFPKANLVVEDDDKKLKFKILVDDDGKITLLDDGEHSDPDVTLLVPLRDALNIFSNAQNINPITLIGFAVNVKTEPIEIKNQVIQKVLRGEV